jgi:hypothetical protein
LAVIDSLIVFLSNEADMSDGRKEFGSRVNRLSRRHNAMARGYTANIRGDGLIVVQPRRFQFKLPIRGFVLLMAVFMIFKGFMLASLGDQAYYERLSVLRLGSTYEQAGAFVMGIDPVSQVIADSLKPVLN